MHWNFRQGLKENGIFCIKENVTSSDKIEIDKEDSSITRPYKVLVEAFKKSGFECIKEQMQTRMPDGIYPIYMFALKATSHE